MLEGRKSGVLCHITSLPNEYCIGDFGPHAYNFVDFLAHSGQSYWQVLPLTQPGSSFSPYQSVSIYGLNPMMLSPDGLYKQGLVSRDFLEKITSCEDYHKINFNLAQKTKTELIHHAVQHFVSMNLDKSDDYISFVEDNDWWLKEYSRFMAIRDSYKGLPWNKWDKDIANRKPEALKAADKDLAYEIKEYNIAQYWLYYQWHALKRHANESGIKIIGDIPMYPDFDSVIVWRRKEMFMLDRENNPVFVAGVPPDYFCPDGQYWGNPFYNWDYIKETDYQYWRDRITRALRKFDIVRLDHFRAFSKAWRVKVNPERSAKNGEWIDVPGYDIFMKIRDEHPDLPIIAEDLGDIDDEVRKLRDAFCLPGMSIMQFAFDSPDSLYLPHNQVKNRVLYTGTHDNNTTIGWWKTLSEEKKSYIRRYLDIDGMDISWQMIKSAARCVCDTVIYPIQDIVNLDEKYRMNVPGVVNDNNWAFRFTWDMVSDYYYEKLKEITGLYYRN